MENGPWEECNIHAFVFCSRMALTRNTRYIFTLLVFIAIVFALAGVKLVTRTRLHVVAPSQRDSLVSSSAVLPLVVPFSAYVDKRPRGAFKNATVILASVAQHIRREITVSCEIDGRVAPSTLFRDTKLSGWINHHFKRTHTDCILYCYDMEVNRNSTVNLIYRANGKVWSTPVRSAVLLPAFGPEKDSVMVCATGYGQPDYLDQWLVYQQSIKVQFIHLNVHESFLTNLNKSSMLRDLTRTGYVEILVWKEYLNSSQVYYYSQTFKYMDCLYRYQNQYRFMMLVDFDEYFIPFTAGMNVYTLAKWGFDRKKIGNIFMSAKRYYCKVKNDTRSLVNGNITDLYDDTRYLAKDEPGKSIILTHVILELHAHRTDHVFSPYKELKVKNCYIAHFSTYEWHTKLCT